MYFSRVTNGWDLVYLDDLYDEKFKRTKSGAGGTYYYFPDRVNETSLFDIWTFPYVEKTDKSGKYGRFLTKPYKYVSCSPTEADTDGDGMDDYYELFHGMNPLLGGVSFKGSILPGADSLVDVVYDAWRLDDSDPVFESWRSDDPASANYWTYKVFAEKDYYKTGAAPRGTGYDFEYFPWLNGLATADPDGDDVRNQSEAIMPKMASKTWMHTDPTPLWMTDTSYARSLTRMFYRMPGRDRAVPTPGDSFTYKGVTYEFRDFGGWWEGGYFLPCQQDLFWYLYGAGGMNWMF